jgi:hypothetical protein
MNDEMKKAMNKDLWFDIAERLFWTLLQAAAGFLAAFATDNVYVGLATSGVAAVLKGFIASKFGNGTASSLPGTVEPVPGVLASDDIYNNVIDESSAVMEEGDAHPDDRVVEGDVQDDIGEEIDPDDDLVVEEHHRAAPVERGRHPVEHGHVALLRDVKKGFLRQIGRAHV